MIATLLVMHMDKHALDAWLLNVESDALSRIYAPAPSRVPPHLLEQQVRRDRPATIQWKGDRFGPPADLRVRGGQRPGAG